MIDLRRRTVIQVVPDRDCPSFDIVIYGVSRSDLPVDEIVHRAMLRRSADLCVGVMRQDLKTLCTLRRQSSGPALPPTTNTQRALKTGERIWDDGRNESERNTADKEREHFTRARHSRG